MQRGDTLRGAGSTLVTIDEFNLGYSEKVSYTQEFAKRLGIPFDLLFSAGRFQNARQRDL